jgi:hypothetical protein
VATSCTHSGLGTGNTSKFDGPRINAGPLVFVGARSFVHSHPIAAATTGTRTHTRIRIQMLRLRGFPIPGRPTPQVQGRTAQHSKGGLRTDLTRRGYGRQGGRGPRPIESTLPATLGPLNLMSRRAQPASASPPRASGQRGQAPPWHWAPDAQRHVCVSG